METDDLIRIWKKQNEKPSHPLTNVTLLYLIKKKSQGALNKIRRNLTKELIFIAIAFVLCNVLFVLVKMPYTAIRWGCFILFNLISGWYIYYYFKAINSFFKLRYADDLKTNLERHVENLRSFCNTYKLLNLPIIFVCIVMFAGFQKLFILLPWMVLEFLLWRSILLPKMMSRFEGYKFELEYSLRNLQDIGD